MSRLFIILGLVLSVAASAQSGMIEALAATKRSPDIPLSADIYGRLLGDWDVSIVSQGAEDRAEWRFGRILQGRAIADVFIGSGNHYGVTIRTYDRDNGVWQAVWIDPLTATHDSVMAKAEGDRIVEVGSEEGHAFRWTFHDITADSFLWTAETRDPDGEWRTEMEMRAVRRH